MQEPAHPEGNPLEVERAFLAAWPARHEEWAGGWLVRVSDGHTKRVNSVTVLGATGRRGRQQADGHAAQRIAALEAVYAAAGLPAIFRIPDFSPDRAAAEAALLARGYRPTDPCLVLRAPARHPRTVHGRADQPHGAPRPVDAPEWVDIHARLAGLTPQARIAHAAILGRIRGQVTTAVLDADGQPACCAVMVADGWFAGLFDVITAPAARRRGLARAMTAWMLGRAAQAGARGLWLQVLAANGPAVRLYAGLGFADQYGYAYWLRPSSPSGRASPAPPEKSPKYGLK